MLVNYTLRKLEIVINGTSGSVSHTRLQIFNLLVLLFLPQPLKDKLSVPYMKLSYFVSPLYLAYSFEQIQGSQHTELARLLEDTSFYLNSTVTTLRHQVSIHREATKASYDYVYVE